MTQYKPTHDYIIVSPEIAPEQTETGLFIPEQARENAHEGTVFDIGPNVTQVQPGDKVVFLEHSGTKLKDNGVDMVVVSEPNIILRKPMVKEEETGPHPADAATRDEIEARRKYRDLQKAAAHGGGYNGDNFR